MLGGGLGRAIGPIPQTYASAAAVPVSWYPGSGQNHGVALDTWKYKWGHRQDRDGATDSTWTTASATATASRVPPRRAAGERSRQLNDLKDLLARSLLFGLGAAALTADRLQQTVDQAVARGEVSREEGRNLVNDVMSRADREWKAIESRINEQVARAVERLGAARRDEISALQSRVDRLESRLNAQDAGPLPPPSEAPDAAL